MSDLILRSALIEDIERSTFNRTIKDFFEDFVDDQPTVEAKPVVYGEWKSESGLFFPIYRCAECNYANAFGQTKFCPNCGADMRKKVQDGKID